MQKRSYAITEIVGTSSQSVEEAIANALAVAHQSLNHLGWFQVLETRGLVRPDLSLQYQVVVKLGFRYDKSWPAEETTPPVKPRR
ncbi:MAG: dodecin domain-containing protein [Candidatus Lambdaproteobacteria bacterium]|nr:dodecin domain-containing protein [Candidatus Lambdaproteobacteria bacterium]